MSLRRTGPVPLRRAGKLLVEGVALWDFPAAGGYVAVVVDVKMPLHPGHPHPLLQPRFLGAGLRNHHTSHFRQRQQE